MVRRIEARGPAVSRHSCLHVASTATTTTIVNRPLRHLNSLCCGGRSHSAAWVRCRALAVVLLLGSCSPSRVPAFPPYCTGMLPEYDVPRVSYQARTDSAELWLRTLTRLDCQDRQCEKTPWTMALSYTTKLDHLDEPVMLSGTETYRLIVQDFSTLLLVRIERHEDWSELVVKVTRGSSAWRPAVQTIRRRSRALSEPERQRVAQAVREYGLWDQPVLSEWSKIKKKERGAPLAPLPFFHGANAILEGVDSEQHHVIWRMLADPDDSIEEIVDLFWELADCAPGDGE